MAPTPEVDERVAKVSSILVTQAKPSDETPYTLLAEKYNLKIDFRAFIEIQPQPLREFRKSKINLLDYTAAIFTSRHAVDNFFRLCIESKVEMPADMKYFCVSEQTANYLQKHIVVRKRKIFVGAKTAADLFDVLRKHKTEKYIFPCSNIRTHDIPDFMQAHNFNFTEAVMYKTVASDLSDLAEVKYDVIAFFSPSGVESLFTNFPDFVQNGTRIAAFGPTTAKAVTDANLFLDIMAPLPNAPSMTGALELYVKKANNIK
ncbi:MAG: uroporphyrinogen-III synthase [Bacteroidota bacterium]